MMLRYCVVATWRENKCYIDFQILDCHAINVGRAVAKFVEQAVE